MPGLSTTSPPPGERDELTPGCRVPAGSVVAHVPRRQKVLAEELVDESGLAHAGRAHEGSRDPRRELRPNGVEAEPGPGGHGVDGHRASDLLHPAATDSGSPSRSAFVSRITGRAPLSQARVRYRSSTRAFTSSASDAVTKTTSTFAAIACSLAASDPGS